MTFPRTARRFLSLLVSCSLLAACFGDSNAQQSAMAPPASATAAAPTTVPTAPPQAGASRMLPDFAALVEHYGPAVVNVEVVQKAEPADLRGGSPDDPFSDFFRRFGIPAPGQRGSPVPARGAGSGFIVTRDGYVLTNAHVVSNASEVTVRLTDRREFAAKVIGADRNTDVAVIKIDAKDLPTVTIGDANQIRPGEWVVAIGSPFGMENSVTAGIVSATSRSIPGDTSVPFIQTDVAVNPGNSGGPLFNMRGEVIGINSQIYSQTGGYMGVSFAIPIDVAMNVQDQLVKTGRVTRGRIGVTIQEVNAQFAESFGLDRPYGALISSVEDDGPADKAGLKSGDVILEVNGAQIERSGTLPTVISRIKPGTTAQLTVWRNGKRSTMSIKVGEFAESDTRAAARGGAAPPGANQAPQLGLAVRPLQPEEKEQAQTEGSLVVERTSGPAASGGVRPGDIILGVNGQKVKSVAELQAATKKAGSTVALLIQRGDAQIFVPIRVSGKNGPG